MRDDVSWGSSFLKLKRNGGDWKKSLSPHPFADIDCSYLDFSVPSDQSEPK